MKAIIAIGLILLCLWGASQLPPQQVVCRGSDNGGLALGDPAALVVAAVVIFLAGGLKRQSMGQTWLLMIPAAAIVFGLFAMNIISFKGCPAP